MQLTAKMVEHVLSEDADPWRIGNHVLYDLCSRYPRHNERAELSLKSGSLVGLTPRRLNGGVAK